MVKAANHREELKWSRTREVVAIVYNTNAKRGRTKKSTQLYPLQLDKKRPTANNRKEVDAMAKKRFPEWFDKDTGVLLKAPRKL